MTDLNQADSDLIKRIIDLNILSEQDNNIIRGYMTKLIRQDVELEYCNLVIEQAQVTIANLRKELK